MTARCPAGTCYAGADGCATTCASGKACSTLSVDCVHKKMNGRTCTAKTGDPDPTLDPLFNPKNYSRYKK